MRSIPFTALVALAACGTATTDPQPAPEPAKREAPTLANAWVLVGDLAGAWKNERDTGDLRSYEQWWKRDSARYEGLAYVLSGPDTVHIEDLRIVRSGTRITYGARISTQNRGEWVEFELQNSGGDTLLFANPQHDFPTEIRYVRSAPSVWDVQVKGGERSFKLRYVHRPSE
jgi:hypothetical protein